MKNLKPYKYKTCFQVAFVTFHIAMFCTNQWLDPDTTIKFGSGQYPNPHADLRQMEVHLVSIKVRIVGGADTLIEPEYNKITVTLCMLNILGQDDTLRQFHLVSYCCEVRPWFIVPIFTFYVSSFYELKPPYLKVLLWRILAR